MQTFVAVVEAGGISAAADRLSLAKSAVSRRIAELEAHLGVQVLTRTTRQQFVTEAGRAYYEQCRRILGDIEDVEATVARDRRELTGKLRLAAPLTFAVRHLSEAIRDFARLHPSIELELDFDDRRNDLVQEGIDLAVRIGALPSSSLVARRLTAIHHVVCASPAYLAEAGTPQRPDDLLGHRLIHYSNLSENAWRYRDVAGREGAVRVRPSMLANNGDFIRCAGFAGLGVIMQPTFVVHEQLRDGSLVPLLTQWRWMSLQAYAVYPSTRHLSGRVRTFIDFLVERFAGVPEWDRQLPGLDFDANGGAAPQ